MNLGKKVVAIGGAGDLVGPASSVATTMGSVGPTGATAGNPSGWFRMYSSSAGRDVFVPFW